VRFAYKILIALGVAIVVLVGVPATYALATGKTQALKGLIQTLKYMLKVHIQTLEKMVKAYVKYLKHLP